METIAYVLLVIVFTLYFVAQLPIVFGFTILDQVGPRRLAQGLGVLVALTSLGFEFNDGAVTFIMWRDNPTLAAVLVASGAFIWKFTDWLGQLVLDNDPSATRLGGPVVGGGVVIPKTETQLDQWVGRSAVTLTTLRPVGRIEIDKIRLEAMSQTGFLEVGVSVRVTGVQGNALLVQPTASETKTSIPSERLAPSNDEPVASRSFRTAYP